MKMVLIPCINIVYRWIVWKFVKAKDIMQKAYGIVFTRISHYLSDSARAKAAWSIAIFMPHFRHSCGLLTPSDSEKKYLMTNCN